MVGGRLLAAPNVGSRVVRVGLTTLGQPTHVNVMPSGGFLEVFDPNRDCVIFAGAAKELQVRMVGRGLQVTSQGRVLAKGGLALIFSPIGRPPNHLKIQGHGHGKSAFRGSIEVSHVSKGALRIINIVDIDDYLKSVVPCEMWLRAPAAAQEAQAIAARTYALHNRNRHGSAGFDLCDKVHCQVYRGMVKETSHASRAVMKTAGIILEYRGAPINAVYHSNCGGYLLSSRAAWGGKPVPYLLAHQDSLPGLPVFCEIGRKARNGQAPPKALTTLPKLIIRTRSDKQRSNSHSPFGHRVGLCQDGAGGMALLGFPANYIVAFYYPGSRLISIDRLPLHQAPPRVVAQLPPTEASPSGLILTKPPRVMPLPRLKDSPLTLVRAHDNSEGTKSVKDTLSGIRRIDQQPAASQSTGRPDAFRKWFWCTMPPHAFARSSEPERFSNGPMLGSLPPASIRKASPS